MAYFNQLQGYMSNLQEGINHENDVKQEYGEQKATTIEDKFNAISQQAEGWGGALTGAGTVWKHGRKVFRTLQSQGQAATDATTNSVAAGAGDNVIAGVQGALNNVSNAGAQFGNAINSLTANSTAILSATQTPAQIAAAAAAQVLPAAQGAAPVAAAVAAAPVATAAPVSSATAAASQLQTSGTISVARGGVVQGGIQGGGSSGVNMGNVINANPPPIGPGGPLQNVTPNQTNIAATQQNPTPVQPQTQPPANPASQQNPANPASQQTPNPNPNGNPNGRNVGDDGLGGDADDAVSNVASKVMGGMDAALDGIPVIGEIIGIGSLIGGLIHGLDKKGEEAKATAASSQTGTVGGGIDTSVFKGNTLGAGGGGYIA